MSKKLSDKELWDYLISQDQYLVQEFGLGIVGIGALLWAYGSLVSVNDSTAILLRNVIALTGLGGSLILWLHIFGTRKEAAALVDELEKTSPEIIERYRKVRSWRRKGLSRYLYIPTGRIMTYFAGLVTWTWFSIILLTLKLVQEQMVLIASIIIFVFAVVLLIYRAIKMD